VHVPSLCVPASRLRVGAGTGCQLSSSRVCQTGDAIDTPRFRTTFRFAGWLEGAEHFSISYIFNPLNISVYNSFLFSEKFASFVFGFPVFILSQCNELNE
jgi:hypothetical protein